MIRCDINTTKCVDELVKCKKKKKIKEPLNVIKVLLNVMLVLLNVIVEPSNVRKKKYQM